MIHILILDIAKEASGIYVARVESAGELVTKPAVYNSIEAAIAGEASAVPSDFAHFLEVRYDGFSSGTEFIEAVAAKATQIANRLIALVAERHLLLSRQQAG